MAFRVTFTQKNGSTGSATFPTETLAKSYCRSVKNGKVQEVDGVVSASVTKCPPGTLESQREATKQYYREIFHPETKSIESAEMEAERKNEHFFESAIVGMTMVDAQSDWDFVQSQR